VLALIRQGPADGSFSGTSHQPREALMYAQLTYFDGPRSPEQLAAADFAGRERIISAVSSLGQPIRVYRLCREDGSQVVIAIADSEQVLRDAQKAIMATELLPGEEPALLPGPDRVELYPVLDVHDLNPATPVRS
jgi:hypothetical protein